MNEFEIIDRIIKRNSSSLIGDDCSIVDFDEVQYLVTTTDMLVENIHFRLSTTSFHDLGYKTLAVNISDIAAMAAKPHWAHLSLAVPPSIKERHLEEFFQGFHKLADQYNIQLMGGDLSSSPSNFFINLVLSGKVDRERVKQRNDFRPGDTLFVSGSLGDSAAGLRLLEEGIVKGPLVQQHLCPSIHLEKALELGKKQSVHGMMDISDGLLSDLRRASSESHCGFVINVDKLPFSKEFQQVCKDKKWDPLELALAGGEDYCLLFSTEKNFQCEGTFPIGEVVESGIEYQQEGKKLDFAFKAFSHF